MTGERSHSQAAQISRYVGSLGAEKAASCAELVHYTMIAAESHAGEEYFPGFLVKPITEDCSADFDTQQVGLFTPIGDTTPTQFSDFPAQTDPAPTGTG